MQWGTWGTYKRLDDATQEATCYIGKRERRRLCSDLQTENLDVTLSDGSVRVIPYSGEQFGGSCNSEESREFIRFTGDKYVHEVNLPCRAPIECVDLGTCVGNAGAGAEDEVCNEDTECQGTCVSGGSTGNMGVCENASPGGKADGEPCPSEEDTECKGYCQKQGTCASAAGQSDAGQDCTVDSDCKGRCDTNLKCTGAGAEGDECFEKLDGGAGTGEGNHDQCQGICIEPGTCDNSTIGTGIDGESCTDNSNCIGICDKSASNGSDGNGRCANAADAPTKNTHGQLCRYDSECRGQCLTVATVGNDYKCYGTAGTKANGDTCAADAECSGYCDFTNPPAVSHVCVGSTSGDDGLQCDFSSSTCVGDCTLRNFCVGVGGPGGRLDGADCDQDDQCDSRVCNMDNPSKYLKKGGFGKCVGGTSTGTKAKGDACDPSADEEECAGICDSGTSTCLGNVGEVCDVDEECAGTCDPTTKQCNAFRGVKADGEDCLRDCDCQGTCDFTGIVPETTYVPCFTNSSTPCSGVCAGSTKKGGGETCTDNAECVGECSLAQHACFGETEGTGAAGTDSCNTDADCSGVCDTSGTTGSQEANTACSLDTDCAGSCNITVGQCVGNGTEGSPCDSNDQCLGLCNTVNATNTCVGAGVCSGVAGAGLNGDSCASNLDCKSTNCTLQNICSDAESANGKDCTVDSDCDEANGGACDYSDGRMTVPISSEYEYQIHTEFETNEIKPCGKI